MTRYASRIRRPIELRYRDDAGQSIRERCRSVDQALARGQQLALYGLTVWLVHAGRRPVRCVA